VKLELGLGSDLLEAGTCRGELLLVVRGHGKVAGETEGTVALGQLCLSA
jgi:hypothetical protein